jgi:hypothetical protein
MKIRNEKIELAKCEALYGDESSRKPDLHNSRVNEKYLPPVGTVPAQTYKRVFHVNLRVVQIWFA